MKQTTSPCTEPSYYNRFDSNLFLNNLHHLTHFHKIVIVVNVHVNRMYTIKTLFIKKCCHPLYEYENIMGLAVRINTLSNRVISIQPVGKITAHVNQTFYNYITIFC